MKNQSLIRTEFHPEDGGPPKIAGLTISAHKATVRLDGDTTFTLTPPKGTTMSLPTFVAEAQKWAEVLPQVIAVCQEIQGMEDNTGGDRINDPGYLDGTKGHYRL